MNILLRISCYTSLFLFISTFNFQTANADVERAKFLVGHLNSGNHQQDVQHIRECGRYSYEEIFTALLNRFTQEVRNIRANGISEKSKRILEEVIEAQRKITHNNHQKYLLYLENQAIELRENLYYFPNEEEWLESTIDKIYEARDAGQKRLGDLRTLASIAGTFTGKHSKYLEGRNYKRTAEPESEIEKPVVSDKLSKKLRELIKLLIAHNDEIGMDVEQGKISLEDKLFVEATEKLKNVVDDSKTQNFINDVLKDIIEYQSLNEQYQNSLSAKEGEPSSKKVTLFEILNRIESYIERNLIDQEEVVDLIMDQEFRVAFKGLGQIKKPTIKYLIGEPGTGKDTAIETKMDAIHGYAGAYRDHMFRTPVAAHESDLWTLLGASTGYRGSEHIPPFLEFLVAHAAGRYQIVPLDGSDSPARSVGGEAKYRIRERQEWRPGMVYDGYFAPESAEVFVNERHNWSKSNTDQFLKQFLEKGYVTVKNPNGGVTELYVPVNITIASNEGMYLTTSKDERGKRFGEPMNHAERMRRYEEIKHDKQALRESIRKTNHNLSARNPDAPGISDETLNRIDDSSIIYMKPTSPEAFRKILSKKMSDLQSELMEVTGSWGPIDLSWDDNLIPFMQEFRYVAENNSRPADGRIASIVENTLFDAIRAGHIQPEPIFGNHVHLKIKRNSDGTATMEMKITPKSKDATTKPVEIFIRSTEGERHKQPISEKRLDELLNLPNELQKRVFGIEHITERLTELAISMEESLRTNKSLDDAKDPAKIIAYFGMSSTGKSQTSKVVADVLKLKHLPLNFGQAQSKLDIKRMFFGEKSGDEIFPSVFMQHYDRNPDGLVVSLEELVNANNAEQNLNILFDLFREPVVSDFADGVSRAMGKIIFIINANIGIEEYQKISKNLPEYIRLEAYREIHENIMSSPSYRRAIMERYLSAPLINRIDERNIFFFGPLGYQHVRQLSYLQMKEALQELKPHPSRRGWNIYFPSEEAFTELINELEKEAFNVESQGASIVSMFTKVFVPHFRMKMYQHKIPSGANLLLAFDKENTQVVKMGHEHIRNLAFKVYVEGQKEPISFTIRGKEMEEEMENPDINQKLVGIHEAGHAILEHYFFGEYKEHLGVSIIPGATRIGNETVAFDGIARSKQLKRLNITREYLMREIAVLFGGVEAQKLTTKGSRHDTGKTNDMKRATQLVKLGILYYGLDDEWGYTGLDEVENIDAYISSLTPEKRKLFDKIKDKIIKEAQQLAREGLLVNLKNSLLPMSSELALKGKMFEKDMKNFLQRHTIYTENSAEERIELIEDIDILLDTFRKQVVNDDKNRRRTRGVKDALIQTAIQELQQNEDLKVAYSPQLLKEYLNPMLIESLLAPHFALKLQEELLPSIESVMTKSVANVIDFHEQERKRAVDKVKPSETPPLLNSLTGFEEAAKQLKDQGVDCELALSSQGERPLQQAM